ncbi:MAG: hypothetical protein KKC20_22080 [Proteobacteria bacterium]|nr:hypothetical protein [Pseudomonadota bacterium]
MIETLFFPFSHISKEQLKIVSAFFHSITFLPLVADFTQDPLLGQMTEKKVLQPVFPLAQDLGRAENQARAYLDWATLHRGNEKNLKSLLKDQPYFIEDTDIPSIRSQIRSGTKRNQTSVDQKKAVQDPLLLLKFAQLSDVQNEGIEDELAALEQTRSLLFSELTGESLGKKYEKPGPDTVDPGRRMTRERLVAWFSYARQKGVLEGPGGMPLLVTTSPAVLDHMVSGSEGVINALDIDSIKVHEKDCVNKGRWQQDVFQFLKETILSKSSSGVALPEADDTCLLRGQIKVCLFPEGCTKAFFNTPGQSIAVCLVQLKS